jgi:hypothetical protein
MTSKNGSGVVYVKGKKMSSGLHNSKYKRILGHIQQFLNMTILFATEPIPPPFSILHSKKGLAFSFLDP